MNKILVTGGAGFIGSHTVEYFREMCGDVRALTRADADLHRLRKRAEGLKKVCNYLL